MKKITLIFTAITAIACFFGLVFMLMQKKRMIPFIPCMAAGRNLIFFIGG
jgi:prepilin signal peptidase PulO-like enzyme (type II secretory pathway)